MGDEDDRFLELRLDPEEFVLKDQWEPDVRLTNAPGISYPSYNNARDLAVSGDTVHIAWFDNRGGNYYAIYYKRSTDNGVSWGQDMALTDGIINASLYPSIAGYGNIIHVVWHDDRDGDYELYYKRSTDGGLTWETDLRLTNAPLFSGYPSLAVSGNMVHVTWYDERDGNNEIYYKRSADGGLNWETDTRLTNDTAASAVTSVAVSGSVVHVVWNDDRNGNDNYELYYKRSTDAGINWEIDTRLTNNPAYSRNPSIAVSDSAVHVVCKNDWSEKSDRPRGHRGSKPTRRGEGVALSLVGK